MKPKQRPPMFPPHRQAKRWEQAADLFVDDGDLAVPGVVDDGVQVLCGCRQEGSIRPPHACAPCLPVALIVCAADASHAARHRPVQGNQVELKERKNWSLQHELNMMNPTARTENNESYSLTFKEKTQPAVVPLKGKLSGLDWTQ